MLTLNNTTKNYRHRSTWSGTSQISQFGNWGLEHMERAIHTKINIYACVRILNNTAKNYHHRSTGSGTSHISQIGNWGLEHMERPIHTKFDI